ncbi:MAG: 5'/3'-nucleotidase SurE [Candidatus Bilamarchaeaceae archaeon]
MMLVTNDDGHTKGLETLFSAAREMDHSAYAIIPSKQRSAIGKALTFHKVLRVRGLKDGIFTLNGTPADCVEFGLMCKDFKKPELVLSGINIGDNTSLHSVLSSGTIGACWESALFGVPAIAFSLYKPKKGYMEDKDWPEEKKLKALFVKIVGELRPDLKPGEFYSVNIPPDFSRSKIVYAKPQMHRFRVYIDKRTDPEHRPYYWVWGPDMKPEKGTDYHEVAVNKNIAVTKFSVKGVMDSCMRG